MGTIKNFEELDVWKMARKLNFELVPHLETLRKNHEFELCKQINRSAGSVMDNIAEGFDRGGNKEFIQFLYISKGSLAEFRSQLYRMKDRNLIDDVGFDKLTEDSIIIGAKLASFISYLISSNLKGQKFRTESDKS